MTTITGYMKDFGFTALPGLAPEIHFKPASGGVGLAGVWVDRDLSTLPNTSTGFFTITLQSLAEIRPANYYEVWIDWLDETGGPVARTDIPGSLWVGDADGTIADYFVTGGGAPGLTWISLSTPPEHGPFVSWLKTDPNNVDDFNLDSGSYYEWEG